MNCIQTDNFIHSRFDNNIKELKNNRNYVTTNEQLIQNQKSYEYSTTTETLSKDNIIFSDQLILDNNNKKILVPPTNNYQYNSNIIVNGIESIDISSSTSSSDKSSSPVTPDDRESIIAVKRSISFSTSSNYRRHRTADVTNTLYQTTNSSHSSISRYLPQNQAVVTTQDNWRISLLNHIATSVLSGSSTAQDNNNNNSIIGKHILDFIDVSHRPLLLDKIVKTRENNQHSNLNGSVLICGDVIPIIKQDGTKSTASLWLKERKNENDTSIFIWIFEEVFQSTIKITLDQENKFISTVDDGIFELFGYSVQELQQQKRVSLLLPNFDSEHSFFGAKTKYNANFPVMIKRVPQQNMIRITSMPTLSGSITVGRKTRLIKSYNAAFVKYLFGYGHDLVESDITLLVPIFTTLITCLERDNLLHHGYTLNSLICKKILAAHNKCDGIVAMHRDGTLFNIDLQIKLLDDDKNYAIWITFDRELVFSKSGNTTTSSSLVTTKKEDENDNIPFLYSNIIRSNSISIPVYKKKEVQQQLQQSQAKIKYKKKSIHPFTTTSLKVAAVVVDPPRPTVATAKITSFSRPSFTSSKSAIETAKQQMINSTWPRVGEYSAQTLKTSIDDYEIISELGQGAYGLVKLACLKSDPEKKRVVIKYVIKSRILVDCWTRDRKLGLIPAEIHVLHTLKKIPHINCSDMLDYFEDEDNYYIIMDLYGAGMDLFDYIELKNGMNEDEIRAIFRQVVSAVGHLHDHRIVHRDIKDENVILDLKGGVRLIDFGSAAYIKEGRKYETFVGTLDYAAPEILKGQSYDGPPQDIWACGTLLYTLIYRENPFYNIDEIMEHELRIPFVLSQDSVDLISKMLDRNIKTRLNIHQVLEHPWFQSK